MKPSRHSDKDRLLTLLRDRFTLEELRTVCFSLGVDFENIAGDTKEAKCRELIRHLARQDRLAELIAYGQKVRPAIEWPDPDQITLGGYGTTEGAEELAFLEAHRRRVAGEKISKAIEGFTLRPRNRLVLQGKTYIVRQVLSQRSFGSVMISAARVSDVSLNRNAGICQIQALTDTTEAQVILGQAVRKAQNYNQAVPHTRHLPHLYDIVDQSPTAVWLVMQWLDGRSLDTHFPQDGPLPGSGKLALLLGWLADICEAIAALHKQHQSPDHINSQNIVLPRRQRGAFLIDPVFAEQQEGVSVEFARFDPTEDLRQLAAVLYRVSTHKPAQARPASDFNRSVPQELAETAQNALNGSIDNAHSFKHALLDIKRRL